MYATEFLFHFIVYLKHKRILELNNSPEASTDNTAKHKRQRKTKKEKFAEEFGKGEKKSASKDKKTPMKRTEPQAAYEYLNPVAAYFPIEKIETGIIYTKDHRYVKIIEVEPINFLLRSAREQRYIIYSFVSYLKISPVKLQIKVLTKKADINKHLETISEDMNAKTDERCIALQKDYENLIKKISSKDAITRRFFIIFEYEPAPGSGRKNPEAEAISALTTATRTAKNYPVFRVCRIICI